MNGSAIHAVSFQAMTQALLLVFFYFRPPSATDGDGTRMATLEGAALVQGLAGRWRVSLRLGLSGCSTSSPLLARANLPA